MNNPSSVSPYIWAAVILFLLATILTGTILFLRPSADPLIVLGGVSGFICSIGSSIMAFMKSQETHAMVNSRLDEMIATQNKAARTEGIIQGTAAEQARVSSMPVVPILISSPTLPPDK